MKKWFLKIDFVLFAVFGLLYLGAKVHFFTRYTMLAPSKYVEEHWYFWLGMAIIGGLLACLSWIRKRIERPKSN